MKRIVEALKAKNKTISTMESCTGGYVASCITDIPSASEVLRFSAVTYSNEYKIKMGVDKALIDTYSVYSIEVARSMAKNIALFANSNYGIGVTGKFNRADIHNPFGSDDKVYVSIYDKDTDQYYDSSFTSIKDNRLENKKYIVEEIIKSLISVI